MTQGLVGIRAGALVSPSVQQGPQGLWGAMMVDRQEVCVLCRDCHFPSHGGGG